MTTPTAHTFHIPVMGTGFTIDTPLRVAKYGISSAIALADDILIEQMRKFHCEKEGELYEEIAADDDDSRARRITAYLNLVDHLVRRQVKELQASAFEAGTPITHYYEMLPETPLKRIYLDMLATDDPDKKTLLQSRLRRFAIPGSIDVNIMTKLNREVYRNGRKLPAEFNDAMAALRGYAESTLGSSIIFSAGMNQRLYRYISHFKDFLPDDNGVIKKKITLKVSDFRSAVIQGKFLAKRGLWVSEYRVESGLNCGGHAFATKGFLLGPILEEFKQRKEELIEKLHTIYGKVFADRGRSKVKEPHEVLVTVQGGIGTAEENEHLLKHYKVDGTGWATPFLLVPEAVNMDEEHLKKISQATDQEVYLSGSSPLGVPFWNLRTSACEDDRRRRIKEGKPGSPCTKRILVSSKEFTEIPMCLASRAYQELKLQHLSEENLSEKQLPAIRENVLGKSCLCKGLASVATLKDGIDPHAKPAVCCGPNIVNFSKIASLEEMVSHIYGRLSLLTNPNRPHMFIKELMIYIDYLHKEIDKISLGLLPNTPKYYREFKENLLSGVEYYRNLAEQFVEEKRKRFLDELKLLGEMIEPIVFDVACQAGERQPSMACR